MRLPWSIKRLIYTGFGLGLSPKAPGTFGTLLGIPIFLLIKGFSAPSYALITLFITLIGWWATQQAETDLGCHDAPEVVIDEVAGYLVTMFLAPEIPVVWLWGFLAFRLFDIWKPSLVGWVDRKVTGAWGVMLDDLIAGVYALILIQICALFYQALI